MEGQPTVTFRRDAPDWYGLLETHLNSMHEQGIPPGIVLESISGNPEDAMHDLKAVDKGIHEMSYGRSRSQQVYEFLNANVRPVQVWHKKPFVNGDCPEHYDIVRELPGSVQGTFEILFYAAFQDQRLLEAMKQDPQLWALVLAHEHFIDRIIKGYETADQPHVINEIAKQELEASQVEVLCQSAFPSRLNPFTVNPRRTYLYTGNSQDLILVPDEKYATRKFEEHPNLESAMYSRDRFLLKR
jgi:hypothetical protein